MAFFKFRKAGDDTAATAAQPESVEVLRRRARHRLIGAAVLVLVGVIGFPLLFDTQPRPVAVDIPIEIPDRNKAKPLVVPASPVAAPAASGVVNAQQAAVPASAPRVAVTEGLGPKEELVSAAPAKSEPKPEPKPETKAAAAPANTAQGAIKSEAKPEPKAAVKADDGARAQALLEGKSAQATASAPAGDGRYVVQVGAFPTPTRPGKPASRWSGPASRPTPRWWTPRTASARGCASARSRTRPRPTALPTRSRALICRPPFSPCEGRHGGA